MTTLVMRPTVRATKRNQGSNQSVPNQLAPVYIPNALRKTDEPLTETARNHKQPEPPQEGGRDPGAAVLLYVKPQLFADTFYFPQRNAKKKKQKSAARANNTKKRTPPKEPSPKRTPLSPEAKKEKERKRDKERRSTAKAMAMGFCRDCRQPAIEGQTRCEACAEWHRQDHRRSQEKKKAANPAT